MDMAGRQRRLGRVLLPDFILFAGTRVALGMGLGLLLAQRLNRDQRKAAGAALAITAGLTTVPLGMRFAMWRKWKSARASQHGENQCSCGCEYCCPPERGAAAPENAGSESAA